MAAPRLRDLASATLVYEDADGTLLDRRPIDLLGEGGIRFVGAGPLVLNGNSDFNGGVIVEAGELVVDSETALGTGDIEIRGGTLRLNHAAIDDRASLRLSDKAQDGAVHLGFTGTDSLHTLQIGDTVQRCGTWGGVASEATFIDPRFSGPGILRLTADPSDECKAKGR